MKELKPGIYQIPLGWTTVYLVKGKNKCLLVDTAWESHYILDSIQSQLAEAGLKIKDISHVVVTHNHPDHYGLAGRIRQLSNAQIIMHELEVEVIDKYRRNGEYSHDFREWLSKTGVPELEGLGPHPAVDGVQSIVNAARPDIVLKGGEKISIDPFEVQMLWTAGHSPGHLSVYEPENGVLFSGDFLLPHITPNISLCPEGRPNPLGDYLTALKSIEELNVNMVLPAHGRPFTHANQRIKELYHHHDVRNDEILRILERGPNTGYQIAARMTWMTDEGGAGWDTLEHWNKTMALMEGLAHMEYLASCGKLGKIIKENVVYYQLA